MNKEEKAKLAADPEAYVAQLKAEYDAVIASNNEEIEALKAEVATLSDKNAKVTGEVPGTYKSKDGKKFRFVKGCVNSRNLEGKIVPSVDLLKDKEYMEKMIELGAAIIEEV